MLAVQPTEFRYKRAVITFFAAYVIVTLLAAALSMAAEAAMHNPPTRDMVHSPSYVFAEKFFPIINLLVWTAFSWVYFKLRRGAPVLFKEALTLGAFWLLFAILVDYVGFVLIKKSDFFKRPRLLHRPVPVDLPHLSRHPRQSDFLRHLALKTRDRDLAIYATQGRTGGVWCSHETHSYGLTCAKRQPNSSRRIKSTVSTEGSGKKCAFG